MSNPWPSPPSRDPLSIIMDMVYDFNVYSTDLINKTVQDIVENSQTIADWIIVQKDQILNGVESIPSIHISKVTVQQQPPLPTPPVSPLRKAATWVGRNKILFGAVVLGVAGSAYVGYAYTQRKIQAKKRRRHARKAANGARIEAVVLASSPREPIAKIIAADLERRGFIVFMTVQPGEEHLVLKEDSPDIRPLIMPSPDSVDRNAAVDKFADLIDRQQHLTGVIILPDLYYPTGPVESISAYDWSDILYSKIVGSVSLLSQGFIPLVRRHNSRILLLTPSILPSLCPPFHAPECVIAAALSSFALCMQRELAPQGVPFIHMRLGSFSMSVPVPSTYSSGPSSPFMAPSGSSGRGACTPTASHVRSYSPATSPYRSVNTSIRADVLSWPENIRSIYGRAYTSAVRAISGTASSIVSTASTSHRSSGSSLKELNIAIFDCLTSDDKSALRRTQFVGKGSFLYYVLGGILPETAVEWVLGVTNSGPGLSGSSYMRTVHMENADSHYPAPDETPDSPLSSAISGSPYNSESESTHQDLTSSWERV
ncbi:hypothetical protein POJ06DRAFT_243810 [Lipomyces tetrasporus]|uniref:DUF1776-domain-containing protein n=1 Tax=Lipomyces tetrasporus TaxID=54092 RepID=A0AAD7QZ99_9ASCO|nr:uncharacterized protein POJ06DRAFT_243810 [Lipomyces tetrasporus]KAJ8104173.1 hypothetical protein POJ06DRAFT_243810 [Lipomyces tetrasporus]